MRWPTFEANGGCPFAAAAVRLLALTGARLREVLDAKWEQVDIGRGVIFLADSKTGRKPIYLCAAQAALAALPRLEHNLHIIPGLAGRPKATLARPWARIRKSSGLDGVSRDHASLRASRRRSDGQGSGHDRQHDRCRHEPAGFSCTR
jgi:integrase